MFGNTTPRNYIVTLRHWPDATKPASEAHEIAVSAYDCIEAIMIAPMRFAAALGGVIANGGKVEAIDVRPAAAPAPVDPMAAILGMSASVREGKRER